MKMKKVVLCSFMCIMFSACQHAVKSNRELFDEQYEKKLKSCVRVMIDNAGCGFFASRVDLLLSTEQFVSY